MLESPVSELPARTGTSIGARAVGRCNFFSRPPYSEEASCLTRRFLSGAHRAAIDQLSLWMKATGMSVRLDPAGTLIGRYEGSEPGAPCLLIGSHIDSVRRAGSYDGALGVMLGLSCVEAFAQAGRRLPFALEVAAFGDEEGSRFPCAMIGSRSMAGILDTQVGHFADEDGITVEAAFKSFGLDVGAVGAAARGPDEIIAYIEPHIEQGPVLEAYDLPVGVVTGIAAQARFRVTVKGMAGHAGTSPMNLRHDAMAAAAEAMLALESVAASGPAGLVGTVGVVDVSPGASNVIPGEVVFSVDLRAPEASIRDQAEAVFRERVEAIAQRRGTPFNFVKIQALPATPCDPYLTDGLAAAVNSYGIRPYPLPSGAGHDAMNMARIAPVAMLFIRCAGGISHNPAEAVDRADVDKAAHVLLRFIDDLAKRGCDAR